MAKDNIEGLKREMPVPCYDEVAGSGASPYVIACDHAGRAVPLGYGTLGLRESDWDSHIAWDIGISGVARRAAALLGGHLVLQNYSRLLIDCNRRLDSETSIVERSAGVEIPANLQLTEEERAWRQLNLFRPYHSRIAKVISERRRCGHPTVFIALHSFTPVYCGAARPWHMGVLYYRDTRLSAPLLQLLREQPDIVVGDNEPYRVTEQSDYSVIEYGENQGIPYVELELRQDLISDETGQMFWATRLSEFISRLPL
jgi:predicted N-formylglutamate amidohydrolase